MAKAPVKENQYDERRETLVVERKTSWLTDLSVPESARTRIASALQENPKDAGKLEYILCPSGFIRHITVTPADVERLAVS